MPPHAFKYSLFPPGNPEPALRPIISVNLIHNNTSQAFDALIDSGSDKTISYAQIGMALGINFDDATLKKKVESDGYIFNDKIEGIGKEEILVYIAPIKIEILGKTTEIYIRWIKQPLNSAKDFPVILGQDSIFYAFDVHFCKRNSKFFINQDEFDI